MTDNIEADPIQAFIDDIDKTEARYKGGPLDKYVDSWLIPKELLIAVRNELRAPGLFGRGTETDAGLLQRERS